MREFDSLYPLQNSEFLMVKDKVKKGDHLTVTTKSNGQVTLEWDWDALLNEVIAVTSNTSKPKKKTKK